MYQIQEFHMYLYQSLMTCFSFTQRGSNLDWRSIRWTAQFLFLPFKISQVENTQKWCTPGGTLELCSLPQATWVGISGMQPVTKLSELSSELFRSFICYGYAILILCLDGQTACPSRADRHLAQYCIHRLARAVQNFTQKSIVLIATYGI